MVNQIERIKIKLEQLKKQDIKYTIYGADKHRYLINPPLTESAIQQFEQLHKIKLPGEYVLFVTKIGDGGAGPANGLESLQNALFIDLDYRDPDYLLDPAQTFPHTEPWNLEFKPKIAEEENRELYYKEFDEFENIYFDQNLVNGVLRICNYGCAISLNLVVNGLEYGSLWFDDRASEAGIYPLREENLNRVTFLEWYERWIDSSLDKLQFDNQPPKIAFEKKNNWWKFW